MGPILEEDTQMVKWVKKKIRKHLSGNLQKGWELWAVSQCVLICLWAVLIGTAVRMVQKILVAPDDTWFIPPEAIIALTLPFLRLLPGFNTIPALMIYGAATIVYNGVATPSFGSIFIVWGAFTTMLWYFAEGPAAQPQELLLPPDSEAKHPKKNKTRGKKSRKKKPKGPP